MAKPRVLTKCVANNYAARNERIVEFTDSHGNGGLISFRETDSGRLSVNLYAMDMAVDVVICPARKLVA